MKLTSKSLRRGAAGIAVASAAILLPAVALASSAATSTPKAAAAPRCTRGDLTAWIGQPGDAAAGSSFYQLEISNVSHRTCALFGYPGVSAIGASGGQLGSAASRDSGHAVRLVTLTPSATAHVILRIVDTGNYPASSCHPATADSVRVYAPGAYTAMGFPFTFPACSKHGPVFLSVSPVLAGAGIPGYSH